MFISQLKFWVWLSSLNGISAVTTSALLRFFVTPEKVYNAGIEEYKEIEGIKPAEIKSLNNKNLEIVDKTLIKCAELGCRVITLQDVEYPDRLRNIYNPPILLYIRGTMPLIDEEPAVAIVGTRRCTPYGLKAAENIGCLLARSGILVVTGLAKGIDTAAARGALRGGGIVVGVIGSGLDIIYPPENKELFDDVAVSGNVISEYPPGSPAIPGHFPARNRIISGLSLGVAVIEAPQKSGALITARWALEQGRDIFTLPGNVDSKNSEGTNALLRDGAIPIISGEDIVEEYADLFPDRIRTGNRFQPATPSRKSSVLAVENNQKVNRKLQSGSKKEIDNINQVEYICLDKALDSIAGDERAVAEAIGYSSVQVDDIITGSGLSAPQVLTALTMLEIKGLVVRDSSMYKLKIL